MAFPEVRSSGSPDASVTTTPPPTEKLTKAAGLTFVSAVTGGLRDLLVAFAMGGLNRGSDSFFGVFLVTQFFFMIAVGGHLLSLGRITALGSDVRDGFYHTVFAPRLRMMAGITLVAMLPVMMVVYHNSIRDATIVAVLSAALLFCRGQAEFRHYVAVASGHLNTAMLAAIWQNILIIVAELACIVAGIRSLTLLVVGVVLGFVFQAGHLRRWNPGPRPQQAFDAEAYRVPWELSGRELLLYGGPALEQLLLPGLGGGVASLVVYARRIVMTLPTAFAIPLGFKLISSGHDDDDAVSVERKKMVVQSAAVLVVLSLAIVQASVVGLRLLAWLKQTGFQPTLMAKIDLLTLLPLTGLFGVGAIAFALHHAMSRQQQVLGHQRRAFVTTAVCTGAQLLGVAIGIALKSVLIVALAYSAAWLYASFRDFSFLTKWTELGRYLRLTLILLPVLYISTAAVVGSPPVGGSVGRELFIVLIGIVPIGAYLWAFRLSRQRSQGSWI
jgi:hypothetical protein